MKSRPATPNRTTSEICDFSLHCSVLNELLFYFCKQWVFYRYDDVVVVNDEGKLWNLCS